jgi:hypothetical protein
VEGKVASNLKAGDKGTIPVQITRVDGDWVTFSMRGYATPVTLYKPDIDVTEPVTPTRRKKGAQHQEPPE